MCQRYAGLRLLAIEITPAIAAELHSPHGAPHRLDVGRPERPLALRRGVSPSFAAPPDLLGREERVFRLTPKWYACQIKGLWQKGSRASAPCAPEAYLLAAVQFVRRCTIASEILP